jgi:hypothetical protein
MGRLASYEPLDPSGEVASSQNGHSSQDRDVSRDLTIQSTRNTASMGEVTTGLETVAGPPRDTSGRSVNHPPETSFYLQLCSSGGGTRTHNPRD